MGALGLLGRRHSGLKDFAGLERELADKLTILQMRPYEATRGAFNSPKFYKEMVRPARCRDFDIGKAFPNGVVMRYPQLAPIVQWRDDPDGFAQD